MTREPASGGIEETPLPSGAIARCGTNNLTHVDMTWFALAPDGQSLVSTGHDGTVRCWACPLGYLRWIIPSTGSAIHGGAFYAGGLRLVTAGDDGLARVFNLTHEEPLIERTFRFPHPVTGVAATEHGERYAFGTTCSREARSRVLLVEGDRESILLDVQGMSGSWYLAFSPDSKTLVALNVDGHTREECRVWMWDTEGHVTRAQGRAPSCLYHGALRFLATRALSIRPWPCAPSGGVDRLAIVDPATGAMSASLDAWDVTSDGDGEQWVFGSGVVYNARSGADAPLVRAPCFPGERALFSVSGGARLAALQSAVHNIALYSLETGEQLPGRMPRSSIEALSFSSDGTLLALCAREDSRLFLFDAESGESRGTHESAAPLSTDCRRALGLGTGIELFSPAEGWPAPTGMVLRRFGGTEESRVEMSSALQTFALSPDSRNAAMFDGRELILLEMHSGKRTAFPAPVIGLESEQLLLSNGVVLISGVAGGRGQAFVYWVDTGKSLKLGIPSAMTSAPLVALAADADCITIAGSGWIRLIVQGVCRDIEWSDSSSVTTLALSPDGRRLAVGTLDGRILLSPVDGEGQATWLTQEHPVASLAFSSDGLRLASGSNASALVWDLRALAAGSQAQL